MSASFKEPYMYYLRLALTSLAVVVAAQTARAQTCNLNPSGPDQLTLVIPAGTTDFDIGWKEDYHDFVVPGGGRFEVCLNNCDTATDPVCDVQGYAAGQQAAGRGFLPPIPIAIGSTAACAVTTFQEPFATGTANIETGAIDVTANISADVYLISVFGPIPSNICPKCSGTNAGDTGTCQGGANNGAACTTSQVITVQGAPDNPYQVSRDCLPSGTPQSTQFPVHVATGTSTLNNLCPMQTDDNACGAGTCTAVCTGLGHGGIRQACCSNNTGKSCFPTPLVRTGITTAPTPTWPDATYPKAGNETIVGTFCAPATPNGLLNLAVGLPGPGALVLPVDATWILDPNAVTTTTTTTPTTSTTTTTLAVCTADAQCADGDTCTQDVCNAGTCSNPPATGAVAIDCQLGKVTPATVCGADPVDSALQANIAAAIAKARTALQQIAAAPAKKQKKLRNAARNALRPILKKAAKAAKKQTITTTCRDQIKALVAQFQQTIAAL
jgi:hypothetical protein